MASLVRSPCLTCPKELQAKTDCAAGCLRLEKYRHYLDNEGMIWMPPPVERIKMEKSDKPRYKEKSKAMFAVMKDMPPETLFCLDDLMILAEKLCCRKITRGTANTFLSLFTRAGYGAELQRKSRPGQPARYKRTDGTRYWTIEKATFSEMQTIVGREERLKKAKEKEAAIEKTKQEEIQPGSIQPQGDPIESVPIQLNITINLGSATLSVLDLLREILNR